MQLIFQANIANVAAKAAILVLEKDLEQVTDPLSVKHKCIVLL